MNTTSGEKWRGSGLVEPVLGPPSHQRDKLDARAAGFNLHGIAPTGGYGQGMRASILIVVERAFRRVERLTQVIDQEERILWHVASPSSAEARD
jgi:hypothetical protein